MQKQDIIALAALARIELSEAEVDKFTQEIPAILDYVKVVQSMVDEGDEESPVLGSRYNVFRSDVVTVVPETFTADILAQMPNSKNRYMVVKKILKTTD